MKDPQFNSSKKAAASAAYGNENHPKGRNTEAFIFSSYVYILKAKGEDSFKSLSLGFLILPDSNPRLTDIVGFLENLPCSISIGFTDQNYRSRAAHSCLCINTFCP